MSFFVENKGNGFENCPPGMHLARCYRIVDLGTQKSSYMGQPKFQHKIMIGWEVHPTDEDGKLVKMRDGRPFAVFANYTHSWSEKAKLRIHLQSWRNKPFTKEELRRFDLKNVLGAFCMLTVIEREGEDGSIHSNVNGVNPVPSVVKNSGLPPPINPNELFTLQNPDMALFETFSDKLKAKIMSSPEWQKLEKGETAKPQVDEEEDQDIPF